MPFGGALDGHRFVEIRDAVRLALRFVSEHRSITFDDVARERWIEIYEQLSSVRPGLAGAATALVIMSYGTSDELTDAYETFKVVTESLGYRCGRVSQENAGERILPDILQGISRAAFTIVDLTELRPNVFYELGYADGLGKRVVVTAKRGTELQFDVKDIPTIFWGGQTQLKNDLTKRIQNVVKTAFSSASPPIGTG